MHTKLNKTNKYKKLKNNDSQCCEFVKIIKTAIFEKLTLETAESLGNKRTFS